MLEIGTPEGALAGLEFPEEAEICLHWSHSVTGGAVADCFVNRDGVMVLDRSYLHDFAAGLGEVPGRGTLTSAPGGGYWITGMNEPVSGNALRLRVGPPSVGHRLEGPSGSVDLSATASGQSVTLRLVDHAARGPS